MLKWAIFLAAVGIAVAFPRTGITKCFTCERADTNEECNGAHLDHSKSPHVNGTLHTCYQENPTCFYRFKQNAGQNGYRISKGCMQYEECLLKYHWQWDDMISNSCFFGNPNAGPPPNGLNMTAFPNADCIYCCERWQLGYTSEFYNGCNEFMAFKQPMPIENDWDDAIDTWEDYPEKVVQVEPADWEERMKLAVPESGAQRHLCHASLLAIEFGAAGGVLLL